MCVVVVRRLPIQLRMIKKRHSFKPILRCDLTAILYFFLSASSSSFLGVRPSKSPNIKWRTLRKWLRMLSSVICKGNILSKWWKRILTMGFCKSFQLSPHSLYWVQFRVELWQESGYMSLLNNHDCTGAADVLKLIQSIIDLIYHSLCRLKAIWMPFCHCSIGAKQRLVLDINIDIIHHSVSIILLRELIVCLCKIKRTHF